MEAHVLTGTWEEITGHAAELAGKTISLTVLTEPSSKTAARAAQDTREVLRRIMTRQAGVRDTDSPTFVYREGPTRG